MFIGSYVAGLIPLTVTLNENKIRLLSIFGAGLLIGTALSVIVPEGIEALYSFNEEIEETLLSNVVAINDINTKEKIEKKSIDIVNNDSNKHTIAKREVFHQEVPINEDKNFKHSHSHIHKEHHTQEIGISLITGFIFMLIIDHLTHLASSSSNSSSPRNKITATVGLVVHAAADGIALGSAAASSKNDVQFIVFFAIMLHKAPAAFGLVSFLMLEGLEKFRIKKHLMVFSLSAPITAILTYQILLIFNSESIKESSSTGILLLFSAGTFLYVATVHVIPELQSTKRKSEELIVVSSMSPGHSHNSSSSFSSIELILLIIGAFLPSLLNSGHSH
uniref:Zinc transporter ZIP9 n=1 Tax=Parastrongyloides trichosuri TaxID=131310 RepID=A0A0N4Z4G4_PARTI